jgi:lipoprotein-releasing system permease protein
MRQNAQLLSALQAQTGSSSMIKAFTMLSVAFGIASVLVVSVVQRSREIGILRSMGLRGRSVTLIFLYQGVVVGAIGSLAGSIMGTLLILGLLQLPGNTGSGTHLFPAQWEFQYVVQASVTAVAVCVVAGIAPARRAAALNPTEVIRYG